MKSWRGSVSQHGWWFQCCFLHNYPSFCTYIYIFIPMHIFCISVEKKAHMLSTMCSMDECTVNLGVHTLFGRLLHWPSEASECEQGTKLHTCNARGGFILEFDVCGSLELSNTLTQSREREVLVCSMIIDNYSRVLKIGITLLYYIMGLNEIYNSLCCDRKTKLKFFLNG